MLKMQEYKEKMKMLQPSWPIVKRGRKKEIIIEEIKEEEKESQPLPPRVAEVPKGF